MDGTSISTQESDTIYRNRVYLTKRSLPCNLGSEVAPYPIVRQLHDISAAKDF